jgi:hypothetical protein
VKVVDGNMKRVIAVMLSVMLFTGILTTTMGFAGSAQKCSPDKVELTFRYVPDENEEVTSVSLRGSSTTGMSGPWIYNLTDHGQ